MKPYSACERSTEKREGLLQSLSKDRSNKVRLNGNCGAKVIICLPLSWLAFASAVCFAVMTATLPNP
eukprot:1571946-Amphidinium_carterae.1